MFCPKCGKGEQTEHSYCRNCGAWLPDLSRKNRVEFGGATPEEQITMNLFFNLLTAAVSFAMAIVLYISHYGKENVSLSVYIAAGFLLTISGWQISSYFIGRKLKKTFQKRRENLSGDSAADTENTVGAAQTKELLPEADFASVVPPTITDDTTRNLEKIPGK